MNTSTTTNETRSFVDEHVLMPTLHWIAYYNYTSPLYLPLTNTNENFEKNKNTLYKLTTSLTPRQFTNNSPDNIQIAEELDNFITLQQQLTYPHTLTIHQLSSTVTSSNPQTPTPLSDYTPSLAQSSTSTETSTSTNPNLISTIYLKYFYHY